MPSALTARTLAGERKFLTVLFCDVVGSTNLAEQLGPDAMYQLVKRFFERAAVEVHRYEGRVTQFMGDGFLALFGAPIAYEDHAHRAVLAALAIRQAVQDDESAWGLKAPQRLAVRIGLHTGFVVLGQIGDAGEMHYTAIGDTANVAARLQALAEPGSIYLSASTHAAVHTLVACEEVGMRTVRGRGQPVRVYKALAAYRDATRDSRPAASSLVGRDAELASAVVALMRLQAGQGGLLVIIGEAGLGKSRLVHEARRHLSAGATLSLEGRSLSYGRGISYWPFIGILKSYAGVEDGDDHAQAWMKLEHRITAVCGDEAVALLPYLAMLLAIAIPDALQHRVRFLDAEAMGRQIMLSTRRFFERLAEGHPVLMTIEDAHWLDDSSQQLLEHILPLVEHVPFLVCVTGRPDSQTPFARLRELGADRYADRYSEVRLRPLSTPQTTRLVRNLVNDADLPARLVDTLVRKADGNPFFVEEVVASLVDLGVLVATARGWRATEASPEITIPDTVQGVIQARIDRLDEETKDILKTASVIGRSFLYRVVRAIADAEATLDRGLAELVKVELLREFRRVPELEYLFRHVLVQEVTYDSLLADRRTRLHRLVGECIEALFAARLEEFYAFLAYHFTKAEDRDKARIYLVKAGDQAGKLAGDAEALTHYKQAFDAFRAAFGEDWDPEERAALELRMGEALFRRGEHEAAVESLQRALISMGQRPLPTGTRAIGFAIARNVGIQIWHRILRAGTTRRPRRVDLESINAHARVLAMMGMIDFFGNQQRLLLDTLLLTHIAERHRRWAELIQGFSGLGLVCDLVSLGPFTLRPVAGYYHRHAAALAAQIENPISRGWASFGLAYHHYCCGEWTAARGLYEQAANTFRVAGHLRASGLAASATSGMCLVQGDLSAAARWIDDVVRTGRDAGDNQVLAMGLQDLGVLTALMHGTYGPGIDNLQQAIALFEGIPDYQSVACASGYLGQCHHAAGESGLAVAALDRAHRLVREHRLRGTFTTPVFHGLALAAVGEVDRAARTDKPAALVKARHACKTLLRLGRMDPMALIAGARLQGTCEALADVPAKARRWWLRSAALAEKVEAPYQLGLTLLEKGARLDSRDDLQRAATVLGDIAARFDHERAIRLLGNRPQR